MLPLVLALLPFLVVPAYAHAAPRTVSPDGAWSYFTEPRAVNVDGKHRRTYVGWIDRKSTRLNSSH